MSHWLIWSSIKGSLKTSHASHSDDTNNQTHKAPHTQLETRSQTPRRISFHFQAINQEKEIRHQSFSVCFLLFWSYMLLRSGRSGGGGGLGSCLFVPEGPAIFITSRIQFPAPASLGLFRGRMRSILTRPLSFLRIRAVITENVPRCDCNPASRAAVFILCLQLHPSGNMHVKHWRAHFKWFWWKGDFFFFLFFLTIHKKTQKIIPSKLTNRRRREGLWLKQTLLSHNVWKLHCGGAESEFKAGS